DAGRVAAVRGGDVEGTEPRLGVQLREIRGRHADDRAPAVTVGTGTGPPVARIRGGLRERGGSGVRRPPIFVSAARGSTELSVLAGSTIGQTDFVGQSDRRGGAARGPRRNGSSRNPETAARSRRRGAVGWSDRSGTRAGRLDVAGRAGRRGRHGHVVAG